MKEWFNELLIVKIGLLVAAFIAIWIATRTTGLVLSHLLDENFTYSVFSVLEVLTAFLFINLCITLIKSTKVKEITEAAIQSIVIALLTFLAFAATSGQDVSIYYASAVLITSLAVSAVAILYVREHYHEAA